MADPEIAALLGFEAVPRKVKRPDGWTPELQRQFIAWLAHEGVPSKAARRMRKKVSGIEDIYCEEGADSFRAAWDAALELARSREEARDKERQRFAGRAPGINVRGPSAGSGRARCEDGGPLPGQVMNEYGEWEDEDSYRERGRQALESIRGKLLRCRRHFLREISACRGKRAAFEILTELPIDWELAAAGKPQAEEPYMSYSQMRPDMVLTAESGISWGEIGYGPERADAARAMLDEYRAEQGLEPIRWDADNETGPALADPAACHGGDDEAGGPGLRRL